MEIQTGILKNFSIVSAPRKNEKENLGRKSLKSYEKSIRKILLKNKHIKNRPQWAVFQICICTDSQFVDLKTERVGFGLARSRLTGLRIFFL